MVRRRRSQDGIADERKHAGSAGVVAAADEHHRGMRVTARISEIFRPVGLNVLNTLAFGAYLACDAARQFNGQNIAVSGGKRPSR
ncbi:hypothetical protein LAUMK40_05850 [Mycobacterium kansasii]|nr:hypothetical protein LAUMK40_05850 [Mycobacterium kansasii]